MPHEYELFVVVTFCAVWRVWLQRIPVVTWPGKTLAQRIEAVINCAVWLTAANLYIAYHLGMDDAGHVVVGGLMAAAMWVVTRHAPIPKSSPFAAAAVVGCLSGIFLFVLVN